MIVTLYSDSQNSEHVIGLLTTKRAINKLGDGNDC